MRSKITGLFNFIFVGSSLFSTSWTADFNVSTLTEFQTALSTAGANGEDDNIKGETRAYLSESLVRQIYKIILAEVSKDARKADRKISRKKSNGEQRPDVQVVIHSNGGAGSASVSEQSGPLGGAKDGNRPPIA